MADDSSGQTGQRSKQALSQSTSDIIELRSFRPQLQSTTDSLEYFDVRPYLPPGLQVDLVEKGGMLYVPHRINEFAIKVTSRKLDLIVLQCLLRYTLGFHRPVCKASHGFMARWTGLQSSNVRRGLRNLKKMGLVKILIAPTASTTAVYEIPIVRGYLDWRRTREDAAKRGEVEVHPNGTEDSIQSGQRTVSKLDTKKEKLNKNRKKTLSPETLPHKITNYIASIRPHQKRVEEEYHLHQLLLDYPVDDILEALDHLQTHGSLDCGEKIHSPMKYLSYTAEEVIGAIAKDKQRAVRRDEIRRKSEDERDSQDKVDAAEAGEMAEALGAFSALDSAEQQRHIDQYRQAHYGTNGIEPPGQVTHKLAVRYWFKSRRLSD